MKKLKWFVADNSFLCLTILVAVVAIGYLAYRVADSVWTAVLRGQ